LKDGWETSTISEFGPKADYLTQVWDIYPKVGLFLSQTGLIYPCSFLNSAKSGSDQPEKWLKFNHKDLYNLAAERSTSKFGCKLNNFTKIRCLGASGLN
jgi:MoaA/NifB/PqqE/SkfB family radical SAM enzyme